MKIENLPSIDTLEIHIRNFIQGYENAIGRNLTEDSKDRIVNVLGILIEDGMYFPQGFRQFQVRGRGEKSIIFHTSKDGVVLKVPIQWTDNKTLDMHEVQKERYNHESFFYGMWSIYEFEKDKQFFRVPAYYESKGNSLFNESGSILMEEVEGRSLYFFALLDYTKKSFPDKFNAAFPNGMHDFMQIKNDDDLAKIFGIKNITETLKQFWERDNNGKRKYMDWFSILEEVFGKNVAKVAREVFEDKLLSKGLEHGDIHPGNILAKIHERTGELRTLYLIDYGNSRVGDRAIPEIRAGRRFYEESNGLYNP